MNDHFATRVVVVALAIVVVGGLGAITYLATTQTTIPDPLDRLVFAALGSLATILVNAGANRVTVDNLPSDPIPTTTEDDHTT